MLIIGVDYHPSFQQIAFLDQETGEYEERRLNHSDGEAERFYRELKQRGISVRVGMEATGYSRWFERLLAELGIPNCCCHGRLGRVKDQGKENRGPRCAQ
jgi:transposase